MLVRPRLPGDQDGDGSGNTSQGKKEGEALKK
jgi:hypothetical protein